MRKWRFETWRRVDREEDPQYDEFFKSTNKVEALVREFIQNSLDAKREDQDHTEVRFKLGDIPQENFQRYFSGLKKHLRGPEEDFCPNDLENSTIPYLLVEDFNTTGLTGSLERPSRDSDESSRFHNFWSRSGISDKQKKSGGRWGLGKTTFHMLSNIRAYWSLTKRSTDGEKYLQGFCEIKSHHLPKDYFEQDNTEYGYEDFFRPYGYFKDFRGEKATPIDDEGEFIDDFEDDFSLAREDEPGLSLVVPVPIQRTGFKAIIKSAIIHYFVPIIDGKLVVRIEDGNGNEKVLNSETISDEAVNLSWENTSWEDYSGEDIEEIFKFTENAIERTEEEDFVHFDLREKDIQEEESWDEDELDRCKELYENGEMVKIRFHMDVTPYNGDEVGESEETFFDIYLQKTLHERPKPLDFVFRGGIHLNEEGLELGERSVISLLHAQDKTISQFLGDAEEPAHTKWNQEVGNFSDEYHRHQTTLGYVRHSASRLINTLEETDEELDRDVMEDFFSVPRKKEPDTESEPEDEEEEEEEGTTNEEEVEVPPTRSLYSSSQVGSNGLRINPKEDAVELHLKVALGYDDGGSNPIKNHNPLDFSLQRDISVEGTGFKEKRRTDNAIVVVFENTEGHLDLIGFDTNRDLNFNVYEVEE